MICYQPCHTDIEMKTFIYLYFDILNWQCVVFLYKHNKCAMINDKEAIQNVYNDILTSEKLINLKQDLKEDPNNTYNVLHNVIQDAKNKHMPTKLVKYNKYKHKKSRRVTFGIIKSMQHRENFYKKLKMSDPLSVEFTTLEINLKYLQQYIKK